MNIVLVDDDIEFSNKLKVASILWKEVRNSTEEKTYSKELLDIYFDKIKEYQK